MGAQLTVLVLTSDLNGNIRDVPYSWSFGVRETACGQAEFYGNEVTGIRDAFVANSKSITSKGVLDVTAYNPNHKQLSWVENTRIKAIDLLHRPAGTHAWLVAKDVNGNQAAFYDDVSLCFGLICCSCAQCMHDVAWYWCLQCWVEGRLAA